MADIQFQDPQYGPPAAGSGPRRSWLTNLVLKTGLATDDAGAQKVLLITLVIVIVAIIAIWVL